MGASPSRDAQQRMLDALCSMEVPVDQKKKRQVVLIPLTSLFMNRVSTSATTSELRTNTSPEELPLIRQLMRAYKEPKVQFCLRHNGWGRADCIPPFLYINSATALYEATVKAYDQRLVASDAALADLWQAQELQNMKPQDGVSAEATSTAEADVRRRALYPIPCAICFQYSTGVTDFPDDDSNSNSSDRGSRNSRESRNSRGSRLSNHSRRSNLAAGRIAPMGSVVMGPHSSIMVVGFVGIVPTSTDTLGEFLKPPPTVRESDRRRSTPSSVGASGNAARSPKARTSSSSQDEWELVMFISKAAGDQHLSRALFMAAYTYISECRRAGVAGCASLPPLRYTSFLTDVAFLSFLREVRVRTMEFRWDAALALAARQIDFTVSDEVATGSPTKAVSPTAPPAKHNRMLVGHLSGEQAMHWCSVMAEAQPSVVFHPLSPIPVYYFYGFASAAVEPSVLSKAKGLFFWCQPSNAELLQSILDKSGLPRQGGPAVRDLIAPQLPPGSTFLSAATNTGPDERGDKANSPSSPHSSPEQLPRRRSPPETQREVSLYAIVSLHPERGGATRTPPSVRALLTASTLTTLVVRQRVNLTSGEFVFPSWRVVTDANEVLNDAEADDVVQVWDVEQSTPTTKDGGKKDGVAAGRDAPLVPYEVLLSWIKGVYLRSRQAKPDHVNWLRAFPQDFYDNTALTPASTASAARGRSGARATQLAPPTLQLPLTRASLDALLAQTQRASPHEVSPAADEAFLHIWDAQPPNVSTPGLATTSATKRALREGNLYMALIPDYVRERDEARKAQQGPPATDPQTRRKDARVGALNKLAMVPFVHKSPSVSTSPNGVTVGSGDVAGTLTPASKATVTPPHRGGERQLSGSTGIMVTPQQPPAKGVGGQSQRSSSAASDTESGLVSPTSTISNLGLQQMWVTGSQYNARTSPKLRGSAGYRQQPPPALRNLTGSSNGGRRGSRRQDLFASTPQSMPSGRGSNRHSSSSVDSRGLATPMSFNSFDDGAVNSYTNQSYNPSVMQNTSHAPAPSPGQSILVGTHATPSGNGNSVSGPATKAPPAVPAPRGGYPAANTSMRGKVADYEALAASTASFSINEMEGQYGLQRGPSHLETVGYSTYGEDYFNFFPDVSGRFESLPNYTTSSPSYRAPQTQPQPPAQTPNSSQRRLSNQQVKSPTSTTTAPTSAPLPRSRQASAAQPSTSFNALADYSAFYGVDTLEGVSGLPPPRRLSQAAGVPAPAPPAQGCQRQTPHSRSARPSMTGGSVGGGSSTHSMEPQSAKEFLSTPSGSSVYRWNWRNTTSMS